MIKETELNDDLMPEHKKTTNSPTIGPTIDIDCQAQGPTTDIESQAQTSETYWRGSHHSSCN